MTAIPGIEGRLTIDLTVEGGRVGDVAITSTRPTRAGQLLQGRDPEQAVALLPLVFAVCGTAQTIAGLRALEQGGGQVPGSAHEVARQLTLTAENAREHFTRFLVDGGDWLGRSPSPELLAAAHQWPRRAQELLYPDGDFAALGGGRLAPDGESLASLAEAIAEAVEGSILGMDPDWFLARAGLQDAIEARDNGSGPIGPLFLDRLRRSGKAAIGNVELAPLPKEREAELAGWLAADTSGIFAARPTWQGEVRETSPLVRQRDHRLVAEALEWWGPGVGVRQVARMVELADLPGQIRAMGKAVVAGETERAPQPEASGAGVGSVEAARGRLIHRAAVEEGVVADYRILAPTEWNFHPQGVLCQSLMGMGVGPDGSEAQERAALVVRALDPCIGFDVEVHHA